MGAPRGNKNAVGPHNYPSRRKAVSAALKRAGKRLAHRSHGIGAVTVHGAATGVTNVAFYDRSLAGIAVGAAAGGATAAIGHLFRPSRPIKQLKHKARQKLKMRRRRR